MAKYGRRFRMFGQKTPLKGLGGFTGLFDQLGYPAFGASMRLLGANYTGGLVRVRAFDGSADQGTADVMPYKIGDEYWVDLNSTLENLDATTTTRGLTTSDTLGDLVDAGGANYDGFVTTWFDQSGNANDASQGTAASQPQIASAGSLILENGKPSVDFDGVDDYLLTSSTFSITQATAISVINFDVSTDESYPIMVQSTNNTGFRQHLNNVYIRGRFSGTNIDDISISPSNQHALFTIINDGSTGSLFWNGATAASGAAALSADPTANLSLVANPLIRPDFGNGIMQESMVYTSDKSAERTSIEANIGAAYGISLP